jgi:hypothetical protein
MTMGNEVSNKWRYILRNFSNLYSSRITVGVVKTRWLMGCIHSLGGRMVPMDGFRVCGVELLNSNASLPINSTYFAAH